MCQIGSCDHTATCIIVESRSGEDVAVCSFHVPEGAETWPIGQSF